MKEMIYTLCPRCQQRGRITSCRHEADTGDDYARVKCAFCGKLTEVPFDENRLRDVETPNPNLTEKKFRFLVPRGYASKETWNKISYTLLMSLTDDPEKCKRLTKG